MLLIGSWHSFEKEHKHLSNNPEYVRSMWTEAAILLGLGVSLINDQKNSMQVVNDTPFLKNHQMNEIFEVTIQNKTLFLC